MATIKQLQTGFANYVDNQIAGAFEGWQKAIVVGGATLLAANIPTLVKVYMGVILLWLRWACTTRMQALSI